jgi:protein-tyrosine phosphatase
MEWSGLLDLAAEFTEIRPLRKLAGYRSMPVLDATAPTEQELRSAVEWVAATAAEGPVYIHCALGHGRSACVVIAYLLSRGVVGTVVDGVMLLRSMRAGVRLHSSQRRRLRPLERRKDDTPTPRA